MISAPSLLKSAALISLNLSPWLYPWNEFSKVKLFVTSNSFQTTILAVPNFPSEILNLQD